MQTATKGSQLLASPRETSLSVAPNFLLLLLLNNCPDHSSTEELCTDDGEISAMFLPLNMTALIQPMDQNDIQNIKLGRRKLLLTNILNDLVHNEKLEKTLKNVNLKDVVFSLANCWASVSTLLSNKTWKNFLSNSFVLKLKKFRLHLSLTNYKTRTRGLILKPSSGLLSLTLVWLEMKFQQTTKL
ncbi:hypothetical protein AVEN_200686-1 [Araneus ventricosus]|uniref:DDE-1 domain-containing protein n=1 Tax=Araneus ventricosus TaxID=182803 RepID=A0A4Y2JBS9_ARAVE|nr:hypothetical protein AVEN_200686-1 [Araneus ventricosus]